MTLKMVNCSLGMSLNSTSKKMVSCGHGLARKGKAAGPEKNFKLSDLSLAEVLDGRQGHFFVRVYDRETKLVDSGEFRYLKSLRQIIVNGEPYSEESLLVPPATGYPTTTVQFIGKDGVPFHPILPPEEAAKMDEKNGLVAEPHPDADEVSCALEGNEGLVKITIHLPRIWWQIERKGTESAAEWRSRPFRMTRRDFQEHADSNTILRLRLPKRIKSVSVGFGDELGRKYLKKDDQVVLPMDDFVDYSQIEKRLTEDTMFNVRFGQNELTLIKVLADPPPKIDSFEADPPTIVPGQHVTLRWTTRNVVEDVILDIDHKIGPVEQTGSREVSPSKTTTYTLRLRASGKEHAKRSFTVTVQAELGQDEKEVKAFITLDLRRQKKNSQ